MEAGPPTRAESAAAVHVVTTAPVEEGLEVNPSSKSPPEVQLFRTFRGEMCGGTGWKNRRAVWYKREPGACGGGGGGCVAAKGEAGERGRRPGKRAARRETESRMEPQTWRPSWVVVALEVIVERHAGASRELRQQGQGIVGVNGDGMAE